MKFSLKEIAIFVDGDVYGDPNIKIFEVAEIQNAMDGSITFLGNKMYAKYLETTCASAMIVSDKSLLEGKNGILVDNPQLAIAKVLTMFFPEKPFSKKIHPMSIIDSSAKIGKDVTIEAGAVIESRAEIEKNAFIGANSFVGKNSKIGSDCKIFQNVVIYDNSRIGKRSIIHGSVVIGCDGFGFVPGNNEHFKIPQAGKVVIGKDVEIGANTVVAAQTGIAGSTKIGNDVMMGGQVGIVGHLKIASGTKIAAQSGVLKDIDNDCSVMGLSLIHI